MKISPIYQSIRMFETPKVCSSAPDPLLFEPFLPWIYKIMLAYQEQEEPENGSSKPDGIRYSRSYYTKKFR